MSDSILPPWGPYSKYLAGASFLTDPDHGIRDEFCFYPCLYRRRQNPPFLSWDSGFHPWDAAPDLRDWSFRFPLTDKREFYADVRYERTAEGLTVTVCFVNGTALPQAAALQGLITRRLPERGPYRQPPLHAATISLPEGAVWRCASDFQFLHFQENSPHRGIPVCFPFQIPAQHTCFCSPPVRRVPGETRTIQLSVRSSHTRPASGPRSA
jgi:hypothetical protein